MLYYKNFGYQWLEGSIRVDLDSAGRGVWADILALASISRRVGYIERAIGIPYSDQELAIKFGIELSLLQDTIRICLDEGRLRQDGDGTYIVSNWDKYQDIPLGSEKETKPKRVKAAPPPLSQEDKDANVVRAVVKKPALGVKALNIVGKTVVDPDTGEVFREQRRDG